MDFPLDAPLHTLVSDRHDPDREALAFQWEDGRTDRFTFGEIANASRDVARQLAEAGVRPPLRVAVVLPQSPLAPVVHLAISRVGAVSVPLSPLLGPEALAPRLKESRAVLAIVHESRVDAVREAAPNLARWVTGGRMPKAPADVTFEEPKVGKWFDFGKERLKERPLSMFFTSGTAGASKAALLPHRVIAGRMPGFLAAHPGYTERPRRAQRFWSPADWSWIGGLHDSLFAPWAAGAPVFAYERSGGFDAHRAAELVERFEVGSAFLPPTALRLWRESGAPTPKLESVHTAGEPLGEDVHAWAADAFNAHVSNVYGMTEAAFLLVNATGKPGAGGTNEVGGDVRVLKPTLLEAEPGKRGELAVKKGSPTLMLGYVVDDCIRLPLDTQDWYHTGDWAVRDEEGRVHVLGRLDDVVNTSGHRVAPIEVERVLATHPAVAECAVVGEPDAERGTVLAAFVRPAAGHAAGDALADEVRAFVRERLAAHLVPRHVRFVDALPRTVNGKVVRRALRQ